MIRALAFLGALCVCTTPALAEEAHDQARERYDRGLDLEEAGDDAGALVEFERAMELRPSYRLHRHIGRVLSAVGRYTEALEHFEAFLEEGGERVEAEQRVEVEAALQELRGQVARLEITAPAGAEVLVDGVSIGTAPLSSPHVVDPGEHHVIVRSEGQDDIEARPRVSSGEIAPVVLERTEEDAVEGGSEGEGEGEGEGEVPDPIPVEPSSRRVLAPSLFWAMFGVSAAVLVGGGVLGGLALGRASQYENLNVPDRDDSQQQDLESVRSSGRVFQIAADVLLLTGTLTSIATLVLSFFTRFGDEPGTSRRDQTLCLVPGGLAFRGRF